MTPAINTLKQKKISHSLHEYVHDSNAESYGLEAAEKLGVAPARVFKTLVVSLDGKELAVGVIPVAEKLSMKLVAKAFGAKKAAMAKQVEVERSTGYVLGGVSPIGQKKSLKTALDISAKDIETIFVSAGRRGLDIEITPADLVSLLHGKFADLCQ